MANMVSPPETMPPHRDECREGREGPIKGGAVTGGLLNKVEIFLSYDPCLGCATHSLPATRR